MLKYKDAMLLFSDAKDKKKGRLLEVNTRLIKGTNDNFSIVFNNAIIVKIMKDDTYTIYNWGKYHSSILKKINKYTPASLKAKKDKWILKDNFKFFNGASLTSKGELKIPEPYKKYQSNECRKCGMTPANCVCPLSKEEYDRIKDEAFRYKDQYGYVPNSLKDLLARGVQKDD